MFPRQQELPNADAAPDFVEYPRFPDLAVSFAFFYLAASKTFQF